MKRSVSRLIAQLKKEVVVDEDEGKKVSDEELLNVFRYADESDRVLKAKEVADQVGLSKKQVNKRLNELEGDRVQKKEVSPTHVWWLDSEEPNTPVRTGANTAIWLAFTVRGIGKILFYFGAAACGLTVFLLMAYLVISYVPSLSDILTREAAAEFSFLSAMGGVAYLILGGLGYLSGKFILRRNELPSE